MLGFVILSLSRSTGVGLILDGTTQALPIPCIFAAYHMLGNLLWLIVHLNGSLLRSICCQFALNKYVLLNILYVLNQ